LRSASGGRVRHSGSIAHRCAITADDAAVRARMRELAAIRRRFGYRRLLILMRREGLTMNHKKFRRLYREERLQVRRRGGCKRVSMSQTQTRTYW
jgi:hypothetical protein